MKKIILVSLLSFAMIGRSKAQALPVYNIDSIKDFTHFEYIIDFPGKTKDELFGMVKKWVALNYVSANDVIQLNDKESGEMVVKGLGKVYARYIFGTPYADMIRYILSMSFKDNKVRVVLTYTDLVYPPTSGTRIGTAYVSGSSGTELSVKLTLDPSSKWSRKKDRELLQKNLTNKFVETCGEIIQSINESKQDNW
jgi:hypothetical protein